jgi:uncharacterized membrane protein
VLFYVSVFEKRVEILPDRGAFLSIPGEYWTEFETGFQNIFNHPDTSEAFINELLKTKMIFSEFICKVENDINELPDNLEVDL